jgi:hypothetical protein
MRFLDSALEICSLGFGTYRALIHDAMGEVDDAMVRTRRSTAVSLFSKWMV